MFSRFRARQTRLVGLLVAGVAFAVWLNISGIRIFQDLRAAWGEERRLEAEIEELHRVNSEIEEEIGDLEENGARIEELARQKLGLAREGEVVVRLPDKK